MLLVSGFIQTELTPVLHGGGTGGAGGIGWIEHALDPQTPSGPKNIWFGVLFIY